MSTKTDKHKRSKSKGKSRAKSPKLTSSKSSKSLGKSKRSGAHSRKASSKSLKSSASSSSVTSTRSGKATPRTKKKKGRKASASALQNLEESAEIVDFFNDDHKAYGWHFLSDLRLGILDKFYHHATLRHDANIVSRARAHSPTRRASDKWLYYRQNYQQVRKEQLKQNVRALCLVKDQLWVASMDGSIHIRDARTLELGKVLKPEMINSTDTEDFYVNAIAYQGSVGDGRVWVGSSDGVLRAYSPADTQELFKNVEHTASITAIVGTDIPNKIAAQDQAADDDSKVQNYLFSASQDHTIMQRDPIDGKVVKKLLGHTSWVRCLCVVPKPDGGILLWSGSDDGLRVWDIAQGTCIATLTEHGTSRNTDKDKDSRVVQCLCLLGDQVWSGGQDSNICIYETTAPFKCVKKFNGASGWITRLTPCGQEVLSVSFKKKIKVWNQAGELLDNMRTVDGTVADMISDGADVGGRIWVGTRKRSTLELLRCYGSSTREETHMVRARYRQHHSQIVEERRRKAEEERKERERIAAEKAAAEEAARQEKLRLEREEQERIEMEKRRAADRAAKEKKEQEKVGNAAILTGGDESTPSGDQPPPDMVDLPDKTTATAAAGSGDTPPALPPELPADDTNADASKDGDVDKASSADSAPALPDSPQASGAAKADDAGTADSADSAGADSPTGGMAIVVDAAKPNDDAKEIPGLGGVDSNVLRVVTGSTADDKSLAEEWEAKAASPRSGDQMDVAIVRRKSRLVMKRQSRLPGGSTPSERSQSSFGSKAGSISVNINSRDPKKVVKKGMQVKTKKDEENVEKLIEAATKNNVSDVRKLLKDGVDANFQRPDGLTALIAAAFNGRDAVAKLLLNGKADVNVSSLDGTTALHTACIVGRLGMINILLSNKADVNFCLDELETPLMLAAKEGHVSVCRKLIEAKADIDYDDLDGDTALTQAAFDGQTSVVKFLIEQKADVNHTNVSGDTALTIAATEHNVEVVDALLKAGVDVNQKLEENKWSTLMVACSAGSDDVVQLLLDKGADVNHQADMGWTALMVASHLGQDTVVDALLKKDALVAVKTEDDEDAISLAATPEIKDKLRMAKMRQPKN